MCLYFVSSIDLLVFCEATIDIDGLNHCGENASEVKPGCSGNGEINMRDASKSSSLFASCLVEIKKSLRFLSTEIFVPSEFFLNPFLCNPSYPKWEAKYDVATITDPLSLFLISSIIVSVMED